MDLQEIRELDVVRGDQPLGDRHPDQHGEGGAVGLARARQEAILRPTWPTTLGFPASTAVPGSTTSGRSFTAAPPAATSSKSSTTWRRSSRGPPRPGSSSSTTVTAATSI